MMNKMKASFFILIAFFFFSGGIRGFGQQLTLQGKITYERKENLLKQLEQEHDSWSESMRKTVPKNRTDQFVLYFNTRQTLYRLSQEDETPGMPNWWKVAYNNTIFTDFERQKLIQEKNVYEVNYHVEDSLPVYLWKLTGEIREIAGFTCKKATTVIMDSIFVIAFYTDEIPVSGGPESISGLPGMILGAVAPRLNFTFFATRVEGMVIPEKDFQFTPVKKAKLVTKSQLLAEVHKAIEDWGKFGRKIYWRVVF